MAYRVERTEYDPQDGFLYYVAFKPRLELEKDEIHTRVPLEAGISLTEKGDIADLSFELPKTCRSAVARTFITKPAADYLEPRVYIAMPDQSGDTVLKAPAKLDLDLAGRIVGMEIQWTPSDKVLMNEVELATELERRRNEASKDQTEAPIAPAFVRRD
jgi:hypothetical protein